MYYYHANCQLGASSPTDVYTHYWYDYSHDEMVSQVVVPFLRKEAVVVCGLGGQPSILNMVAVEFLQVYRTRKPLTDEQANRLKCNTPVGANCTERLLRDIEPRRGDGPAGITQLGLLKAGLHTHQLFVIMKFADPHLDSAYRGVISPIAERYGYDAIRVDDIEDSGKITDQVIASIAESGLILADLSGARPNCYYETGIAHALGRELILTIRDAEAIHFDLAGYRFIKWRTEQEFREKLGRRLHSISLRRSGGHETPR